MSFNKRMLSAGAAPFVASENFKVVTYTGNSSTNAITGVGFQPDFVWTKARNESGYSHFLTDSTRGGTKVVQSNSTDAETTRANNIHSFDSDGFTLGADGTSNYSGTTYVAWCWKANGGTTSTNTDGEITTTVQANQDAGFSIVTFAGISDPGDDRSFGHGLSQEPEFIWMKRRESAQHPAVFVKINGTWEYFDGTSSNDGGGDYSSYIATTSTVVDIHDAAEWFADASHNYVYWMWHSVDGYSKIGTYTGNASDDGTIVETGFEPAFVMIKRVDSSENWAITDNVRNTANPRNKALFPNLTEAELTSGYTVNYLSNGFQIATSGAGVNASGGTFMYMAFAADPDIEAPTLASSFNAIRYRGNGSGLSVSGLGFKPDFIWAKARTAANSHSIFDTIRGINKELNSNSGDGQGSLNDGVLSFDSDGWTMGDRENLTQNNEDFIGWAWKANDNEPTVEGGAAKAVYKFEDNANDVTGNHNGTASNVSYSSSGKFNKAADFSTSGANIAIGSVIPNTDTAVSVSAWVYLNSSGNTNDNGTVIGTGITSAGSEGPFRVNLRYVSANTYKITALRQVGGTYYLSADSNIIDSTVTHATWHHVVWTYNPTGRTLTTYLNGSVVQSTEMTTSGSSVNDSTSVIGNFRGNTTTNFNGLIDQVRIYSGTLQDEQVSQLYAETASDNDDLILGGPPETIIIANANAGFSIVKYEGNGAANNKIPHGLSSTPEFIIIKNLNDTEDWQVFGNTLFDRMQLNSDGADDDNYPCSFSATTITLPQGGQEANNAWNANGDDYVMYCFHSVSGYSKVGSYTGSTSGITVTTGFKPDFLLIKSTSNVEHWAILDTLRGSERVVNPNRNNAESDSSLNTFTISNTGFSFPHQNTADAMLNENGYTYSYLAIAQNVPANTTLADSFGIVEYRGLGNPRKIQGFSFRPDFVWIKNRDTDFSHSMFDTVRGAGEYVRPNYTAAEQSDSTTIQSFNSDGFSIGNAGGGIGNSGDDYIVWGWKAGNSWESNIDGSIQTLVNANTASGFSIIKYNMNLTSGTFTLGHGLSSAPQLIFFFALEQSGSTSNIVYPNIKEKEMVLDNNGAASDSNPNYWNDTAPTSTLITMGSAWTQNHSYYGGETIAYAFHSVSGFCDIDTYSGNGSTQSITGVGFRPDFVIIKETSAAESWRMFDSWRGATKRLFPDTDGVESTASDSLTSFDSDGFSLGSSAGVNESGQTYLYMAYRMNTTLNTTLANSFSNMHYTGTGAELAVTGAGFKPDLVWITNRDGTTWNNIFDSVRGPNAYLATNSNVDVEHTANTMDSFDSDGFTIDSSNGFGNNNTNFAAWAWKAGNGHVSNFEGTIPSIVNANTANGFSIIKWEGTGAQGTIGHGLNSAPEIIISKRIDSSNNWNVYHKDLGLSHTSYPNWLYLNVTSSEQNSVSNANHAYYQVPSSTLIYQHTGSSESTNVDGGDYISYCWHSVSGYSKIDEYTGSGTGANQLINTGFQPDWVMFKDYSAGGSWFIVDSSRGGAKSMKANDSATEGTTNFVTFESNGFRVTGDANATSDWVYMAFKMN